MQFGLQIFQDATLARPNLWDNLLRMALAAEDSGWSSLWMWDHFQLPPPYNPPGEAPMLECMVGLGGLAVATKRVLLGQLVLGVPYRNPALVAKMASTLDVMSHGRSILGIGAGWAREEYEAYGWGAWPETPARMRQLADATRVILAMFGQGPATYEGRHHHVRGALNDPPPVQRPHPPIMIGGSGERTTLRLVARYAQWCNVNGDPARVAGRLQTLSEHCQDVGRPIEEITLSNYLWCVIGRDEAEAGRKREAMEAVRRAYHGVHGSPQQVIDQLGEYAKLGVQHCIVQLTGEHDPDAVRLFGETVVPALRNA